MWETVNETVRIILSLSVSGGLFALALFVLKPFMRNRLSKSFQYYIWIVVLLRFMLPFSFGINLMDLTFNTSNPININPAITANIVSNSELDITEQQPQAPVTADSAKPLNMLKLLADNLLWIWLAGAVMSAAVSILGYFRFVRFIHGAAYATRMPNCGIKVFKSKFAPTPTLIGLIRPRIYLPDIEYSDEQLKNILLHELTHLRRRDVWLKWLVSLVVSVHWFNPIVYFMRREINRACELSCDEAVISNLGGAEKQSYGDTLISVVAGSRYPVSIMSATMCEEKTKLKERLIAIMNYKKKAKMAVLITGVLAVTITGGAFAFGADVTGRTLPEKVLTSEVEDSAQIIPLADLRQLAAKGYDLVFEDFNEYKGQEVGSGLYILQFTVEGGYTLLVGGGSTTGKPHYAYLGIPGAEERIDIRSTDIADFISRYPVPNELSAQIIPLADLRQLAAKGSNLVFEDFNEYEGQEVGSGLYILQFTVEGGYTLLVGGGSTTGKPYYADLSIPGVEGRFDIRFKPYYAEGSDIQYTDIDDFISKYPVPNELSAQIYGYLDTIMSSPSLSSATGDYIKAHQAEYDTIVGMGVTALPALTGVLNADDMSLRGNISALLVQDIVSAESSKSLSEWTDDILQSALSDVKQWSEEFAPNSL